MAAGPRGRGCFSLFHTLSPSVDVSPPSVCPPCALAASSLRYWCASSLVLSPFLPWSLRETLEHRRADSLHRPTINTSAGPHFRPRNRNFHSSIVLPVSVCRFPSASLGFIFVFLSPSTTDHSLYQISTFNVSMVII